MCKYSITCHWFNPNQKGEWMNKGWKKKAAKTSGLSKLGIKPGLLGWIAWNRPCTWLSLLTFFFFHSFFFFSFCLYTVHNILLRRTILYSVKCIKHGPAFWSLRCLPGITKVFICIYDHRVTETSHLDMTFWWINVTFEVCRSLWKQFSSGFFFFFLVQSVKFLLENCHI